MKRGHHSDDVRELPEAEVKMVEMLMQAEGLSTALNRVLCTRICGRNASSNRSVTKRHIIWVQYVAVCINYAA